MKVPRGIIDRLAWVLAKHQVKGKDSFKFVISLDRMHSFGL
jgi:hypothetical protein